MPPTTIVQPPTTHATDAQADLRRIEGWLADPELDPVEREALTLMAELLRDTVQLEQAFQALAKEIAGETATAPLPPDGRAPKPEAPSTISRRGPPQAPR